ncbi:hypothetical protein KPH14_001686 [Odynerus spinipes]|uniref:Serum response factor-binding protein 1 n=1 Tax=Odynerus spinipes TaxID=1348599 RepID=A0AAD9VVS1_9HYME|nr:hypothetical protein KPH14_001686 [Odynerus spinipes]
MEKIKANNEIVRMRQLVRQARVCIIHKLTREARTLRTKNGTEKQQEKNKRKADKLISEIYALKKIKDDRITKFGITSKKSLQEILQTENINESTRIMARVVDYKSLRNAIIQFRETYPDYEEYLKPGKKKSAKQKVKPQGKEDSNVETKRETRASSRETSSRSAAHADELSSDECTDEGNNNDVGINDKDNENSKLENDLEQHNSEPGSILRIKPPTCVQIKHKENTRLKRNRKQSIESTVEHDSVCDDQDSKDVKKVRVKETSSKEDKEQGTVKVISKQATVKRFTELLQEKTLEEDSTLKEADEKVTAEKNPEPEKKVDSFFMSGDGDAYLSVAKSPVEENKDLSEDEDNNYNSKSRRYTNKKTFTNDRFFSNIKSTDVVRRNGKQRESRQSDKDFIRNRDSFRKERNTDTSSVRNATKKRTSDVRENSTENLHPSWAAKKKQQEIIKQGFQGKKIVFADD